ncbi:MAG: DUF2061 domain-containing protein [Candidatus Helarchaeota archaeon]|nr:DUF2061 domain-containing protein [Candidatus Helarchaeota archaeon]
MNLKRNLAKSVIYRIISVFVGFFVTYLVTGDITTAFFVGWISEVVQFFYYFSFESVWSHYDEKRLRKLISKEFREREINVNLTLGALSDMAKEFSQVDTFLPELYNSISNFFKKMLENQQVQELHEDFEKYKRSFESIHKGRGFDPPSTEKEL